MPDQFEIADILSGTIQESQTLDIKRSFDLGAAGKDSLIDDAVAFLNADGGTIVIGIGERKGAPPELMPVTGDADKVSMRLQDVLVSGIRERPSSLLVESVPVDGGIVLFVRIGRNGNKPYCNASSGRYLRRRGRKNEPLLPGEVAALRQSRERLVASCKIEPPAEIAGELAEGPQLDLVIVPSEHLNDDFPVFQPNLSAHSPKGMAPFHGGYQRFQRAGTGCQIVSVDGNGFVISRFRVEDDWIVRSTVVHPPMFEQGEGRLTLGSLESAIHNHLMDVTAFMSSQGLAGPFALRMALTSLHTRDWDKVYFKHSDAIAMGRPLFVDAVVPHELTSQFLSMVQQASINR